MFQTVILALPPGLAHGSGPFFPFCLPNAFPQLLAPFNLSTGPIRDFSPRFHAALTAFPFPRVHTSADRHNS